MRSITLLISCAILALAGLCSCGGSDLDNPQSLTVTTFAAGQPFRLSFTMTSCSDRCAVYASDACTAKVLDKDGEMVLEASPRASVASTIDGDTCNDNQCGFPVAAFCEVPALTAGSWTVRAGGFTGSILIQ